MTITIWINGGFAIIVHRNEPLLVHSVPGYNKTGLWKLKFRGVP